MNELYHKKLKAPRSSNEPPLFVNKEEGIQLIKNKRVAYHTEPQSAYSEIANTFNEQEICELRQVNFLHFELLPPTFKILKTIFIFHNIPTPISSNNNVHLEILINMFPNENAFPDIDQMKSNGCIKLNNISALSDKFE